MTRTQILIQTRVQDGLLSLDELCRASAVTSDWVMQRIEEGLLPEPAGERAAAPDWRFDAMILQRVRRMARIERDFDAAPELAALVADLIDEVEALRTRLRRAGLG